MKSARTAKRFAFLPIVLSLLVVAAFGQTGQGQLVGIVTDSSSAVIPDVTLRAKESSTGFVYSSSTNAEGIFRIINVNPGTYEITFEGQGFKKLVRSGIIVRSTETVRVNIALEIGSVVESVEVKGDSPLLETESSTPGHLVSGEVVNKLPTPQQKTQSVLWYMPGVSSQKGEGHGAGQRSRSFNMSMDGVSVLQPVVGSISTGSTLYSAEENIGEVKVLTTALPAEYGHTSGAVMNVSVKSGTNQLHGLAADRYLNQSAIHRRWEDAARAPKGEFTFHLISAQLSGPVVIPKIYNGRNRTFFLFGFQRQQGKEGDYALTDVPTPAMYAGDFSFGGIGDPIYDPASLVMLPNGTYSRTAFPGNRIPVDRFDPAVKNFLALNPWKPESTAVDSAFTDRTGRHNNFSYASRARSYRTGPDLKIDHSFSDRNKVFGRYSGHRGRAQSGDLQQWFAQEYLDYARTWGKNDFRQFVVSNTYMISPTMFNEVRASVNRRKSSRVPDTLDQDWAGKLGIPNIAPDTFPSFLTSSGGNLYGRLPEGRSGDLTATSALQENLTMVRGRHTFKTGYEWMKTSANAIVTSQASGRFRFGGTEFPFAPNTGNNFASFLLGGVVRADFTKDFATWLPQWTTNSIYFQDDWKVTRKLTLNLGLRWQYETPFQTKWSQQSQFSPDAIDPLSGMKGAILHPQGPLAVRDLNNFQPRVGMAYNFRPRWVFRGGFAVNTLDVYTAGLQENFDEYLATEVVQPPAGNPDVAFYLSRGLPTAIQFKVQPDGVSPFVGTNYSGRNVSYYDPRMRAPYVMNWNAGFQHQLSNSMLIEVTYQGSAGVGLLNRWDINAIPLDIANTFSELDNIRRAAQNFKPYPQFGSVQHYSNYGHNTFHSATVRFEKRYSHGLNLTSFFTQAKAIDNASSDGAASGITFYNRSLEKGRADYDVAQTWTTYATYQLPLGHGRPFLGKSGGLLNAFVGNWDLSVIQTLESGAPMSFTQTGSNNVYLPGTLRPDMAPGMTYDDIRLPWDSHGPCRNNVGCALPWANINAFAHPDSFKAGSAGRNIINAPGLIWHQASIAKQFQYRERTRLTLRFDFNSPFKRYFFSAPNSAVNLRNPVSFGKITSTQGSYSGIGGRTYIYAIFRLEF